MHSQFAFMPLALLIAAPSDAEQVTHPELQIDAFLPALITGLKRNLPERTLSGT
jgi:hypothetical protein